MQTAKAETLLYPNARRAKATRPETQSNADSREIKFFGIICLVHLPLGVVLYNVGSASLLHPIAVMLIGAYWALNKLYGLDRVALAAGYLIGSEVLWRMAQVPVFWETGKFGTAAIMIIALVSRRRTHIPKLPLVYFFALVPACLVTLADNDLSDFKGAMSFTMSGPMLLGVSCWFFSHVRVTEAGLRKILFAVIIPLISVACATLFYVVTAENIQFGTESNLQTSGGFGPNQVSAMLGLGVFLTAGCVVLFPKNTKLRIILSLIGVLLAAQTVLTFSRGGIYNALGALFILILLHFQSFTEGLKRVIPVAVLCLLFYLLIFPLLNNFTGGKLEERFGDTGTTNRAEIIESDVALFFESPVLGLGVGGSTYARERLVGFSSSSHTEFSRMLAEHGSFGLISLLALVAIAFTNLMRQRSTLGRALVAGAVVWGTLFMFNAGMRLGGPSFMWGLAFISIVNVIPRRRVRYAVINKE